jgi:POT family proton-dependent oligopeptide transporter
MDAALQPAPAKRTTAFLGHPAGLAVLAGTEAWERFSFYGMQSLLTLYMIDHLLIPGRAAHVPGLSALRGVLAGGSPIGAAAFASKIFGLYTASVYITPVLGSLLADRWLGRTRAIVAGCLVMAAGHFAMAFDASFLPALALLITGCGLLKGNIASQVGGLYAEGDGRRTDAFQIFSTAVAVGVIAAPLVCGTLADVDGWHWGFGAAGVGMVVAAGIYLAGRRFLPSDTNAASKARKPPIQSGTSAKWRVIAAQLVLVGLMAISFIGNNQVYNIYLVWAKDAANLQVLGYTMPVAWLVSYDAIISTALLPGAVLAWRWLGRRGITAHELTKITGGAAFAVLGSLLLAAAAAWSARTGQKVPLSLLLLFHIVNGLAFVHLLPVGLSLFSRTAPPGLNATMIGVFYTLFFGTNLMVGWIGAAYPTMTHTAFWLMQAGFMAVSAGALAAAYRPLRAALK